MAYVEYTYYKSTYSGTLSESDFNKYEHKAELNLNKETFGNITNLTTITDGIKMCTCELIELLYKSDTEAHNSNVASEKVGDYSVSYANQSDSKANFNKEIRETVRMYLYNSVDEALLYRGC